MECAGLSIKQNKSSWLFLPSLPLKSDGQCKLHVVGTLTCNLNPHYCHKIKPVNSKDQPRIFVGRTEAKAEALIIWPPEVKSQLIGRDPDAGKD